VRRRFKLEKAVRFLAGVFGLIALGFAVSAFFGQEIDWDHALGFSAVGVLFLYGAVRGESPAWLEPPSRHDDGREG
jgi:hypothetical protein